MKVLLGALVSFAAFISLVFRSAFKQGKVKAEHEHQAEVLDEISESNKIENRIDSDNDFNDRVQDRFSK